MLSLKNHRNATTLNSRFDYIYDRRGRRTSMSTLDGDWTYGYDATGQLTRAVFDSTNPEIPDQDLTYEYDASGNRVRTIENGLTNLYVANNLNQYTSVGGTNHLHDADGNLTSDGVNTYEWDQQSRLVRVTGPSGVTEYEYDGFGSRVATVLNGQWTGYLLDPSGLGNVVAEFEQNGSPTARYAHGRGLASVLHSVGERFFYDFDVLGTTTSLTDDSGTQRNRYAYSPFGERLYSSEANKNPFQFIGRFGVAHEAGGLHFMRARFFSSDVARFTSTDPIGLRGGDANFYRYVFNSPATGIDPRGLQAACFPQNPFPPPPDPVPPLFSPAPPSPPPSKSCGLVCRLIANQPAETVIGGTITVLGKLGTAASTGVGSIIGILNPFSEPGLE